MVFFFVYKNGYKSKMYTKMYTKRLSIQKCIHQDLIYNSKSKELEYERQRKT